MSADRNCRSVRGPRRAATGRALLAAWLLSPMAPAAAQSLEELLEMDLDQLTRIEVVSASRQTDSLHRAPATVRVIDARQIAERGYRTLEQALADLPGFQFRDILGFNSYVFLRGLPSQNNKLLLLVDGVVASEPNSGGFYAGGHYNLANVARIEVVYGPASAVYGTNAVSGIIHIITRDPARDRGTQLRLLRGSLDSSQLGLRHAGSHGDFAYSVAAQLWHTDKANLRGASGDFNWTDAADNFQRDRSLDARFAWRGLSGGLGMAWKHSSRASVQRTIDRPLQDFDVDWRIRFGTAWLRYETDPARAWRLRTLAYLRDVTVEDDTRPVIELPRPGNPGSQQRWYRPGRVAGVEAELHLAPHPRVSTVLGVVLERHRLAEAFSISRSDSADVWPAPPPAPPRINNHLDGLYAEARWTLTPALQAHIGLRQDDPGDAPPVRTPRLALVYGQSAFSAKLLYGEAFRAPQPWDRTSGLGNPDLKPEDARSLELAFGYAPNDGLQANLSLYRSRIDGLLVRAFEAGGARWINADGITVRGLELDLSRRWARWSGWGHYAYVDSRDDQGQPVPEIARHQARAGLSWRAREDLRLGLAASYLGQRDNPQPIPPTGGRRLGSALLFDAHAALSLGPSLGLRLQAENLGDRRYYHPSNLPPSRYPQPGRTLWLYLDFQP